MAQLAGVQRPWLADGVGALSSSEQGETLSLRLRGGGRNAVAAREAGWSQGQAPPAGLAGCLRHRLAGQLQFSSHRRTLQENTLRIYGGSKFEDQFLPGSAQLPGQVTLGAGSM